MLDADFYLINTSSPSQSPERSRESDQETKESTSSAEAPSTSSWNTGWGASWAGKLVDTLKKGTEQVADVLERDITDFVNVVSTETTGGISKLSQKLVEAQKTVTEASLTFTSKSTEEGSLQEPSEHPPTAAQQLYASFSTYSNKLPKPQQLAGTAENIIGKLSTGITSLLHSAPTGLVASQPKTTVIYDRKTAILTSLRLDPATYLTDPLSSEKEDVRHRYKEFMHVFVFSEYQDRISTIMKQDPTVQAVIDKMGKLYKSTLIQVPSHLPLEECWQRYFFQELELDILSEKRKQLMHDAENEEDFQWDSEDESPANEPKTRIAEQELQDMSHPKASILLETSVAQPAVLSTESVVEQESSETTQGQTSTATQDAPAPAPSIDDPIISTPILEPNSVMETSQNSEDSYEKVESNVSVNTEAPVENSEKKEEDWGDWE